MSVPRLDLSHTRRAASPLLGIVLMVTITVVVAAAVGTFALGVENEASTAGPDAEFAFDYDDPELSVVHTGGEDVAGEDLQLVSGVHTAEWGGGTVRAGDSWTFDRSAGEFERGGTVRVVWTGGPSSVTLQTYDVPE